MNIKLNILCLNMNMNMNNTAFPILKMQQMNVNINVINDEDNIVMEQQNNNFKLPACTHFEPTTTNIVPTMPPLPAHYTALPAAAVSPTPGLWTGCVRGLNPSLETGTIPSWLLEDRRYHCLNLTKWYLFWYPVLSAEFQLGTS